MAFNRVATFAYGDPSVGGVTLGGENNRRFALIAWDYATDYTGDTVSIIFRVVGHGASDDARAADLAVSLAALQHLSHFSGNLTLSSDAERSFTGDLGSITGSPTWTAVVTASGFAADDIGKVICVDGKVSGQILSIGGSTTATIQLIPGVTVPTGGTGLSCRLGAPLLRYREADRLNGYHCRPVVRRIADPRDNRYRKTFGAEFHFLAPADNTVRDATARQSASFTVFENQGTKLKTVDVTGVYTALGGTGALANYLSGGATYAASVLSLVDSGATFERVANEYDVDDENALCRFHQIWVEKNYADSDANFNEAAITNAQVTFTRRNRTLFGLPGFEAPTYVQISYSCEVDSTVYDDTTLFGVYTDIIKPRLVSQAVAKFGGASARVIDEMPSINPERSTISAYLDVFLERGTDPDLIHFQKTISYDLMTQNDIRARWDGTPNRWIIWTPGPMIVSSVTIEVERVGPPTYAAEAGLLGVPAGRVIFLPPGGSALSETNPREIQVPGRPPFGAQADGGSYWILLGIRSVHTPMERGRDPDAVGTVDFTTTSIYTATWLWGTLTEDAPISSGLSSSDTEPAAGLPDPDALSFLVPVDAVQVIGPPFVAGLPAPSVQGPDPATPRNREGFPLL